MIERQTDFSMNDSPLFGLEELQTLLPHRPPFLFIDRVLALDPHQSIHAQRLLRADEPQFVGHFPGRPIMPGVLVAEALAQASGLLLGLTERLTATSCPDQPRMYFLATTNIKYKHPAVVGDVLNLHSRSDRSLGNLFRFDVEAIVKHHVIASGSLTLALMEGEKSV